MNKNTASIRKLGGVLKSHPEYATKNTGFIMCCCADEIDRLQGELDNMRESLSNVKVYVNQACQAARRATDPESFEI